MLRYLIVAEKDLKVYLLIYLRVRSIQESNNIILMISQNLNFLPVFYSCHICNVYSTKQWFWLHVFRSNKGEDIACDTKCERRSMVGRPEYGVWPSCLIIITLSDGSQKWFPYVTRACLPFSLFDFLNFPGRGNTLIHCFIFFSKFTFSFYYDPCKTTS